MNINEHIAFFLRDAQYYLAELAARKNKLSRRKTESHKKITLLQWEIITFMSILYDPNEEIYGDYSGFYTDWTDDELLNEIEYYRNATGISSAPYLDFVGQTVEVINYSATSSGGDGSVNESTPNTIATYKTSKTLAGKPLSSNVGLLIDDVEDYFNGVVSNSKIEIPFIFLPAFSTTALSDLNPLLKRGQMVFIEDDNGIVSNYKVGPGYWNDLSFQSGGFYSYDEIITNPIGDVPSNPVGLAIGDIIRKMLNPYVAPVLSNALNNASGSYINDTIKEIGQTVSGSVNVQYSVSNSGNLSGSTPINVTAGGRFSNEGNFANGTITLNLASSLSPILTTNIEILIKATHTNGETNTVSTFLRFYPKMIWGVGQQSTITATDLLNGSGLQDRQTKVTNSIAHDITFNQAGYLFIAIPTMMGQTNISFADATDKQVPLPIDMVDLGVISSVNNGVGTYNYQLYRSKFAITESKTIISIE